MGTISTRVPEEFEAYLDHLVSIGVLRSESSSRRASKSGTPSAHSNSLPTVSCRCRRRPNSHDVVAVVDEAAGRSGAEIEGIETRRTSFLVLSAVSDGAISPADGRAAIDAMIDQGWYVAPDLYAKILRTLESFES